MPRFKTILVTGGAGYIGSHCVVDLLEAGYDVVAIDNFANAVGDDEGSPALRRAEEITGKKIAFYKADLLDKPQINTIFDKVRKRFFYYKDERLTTYMSTMVRVREICIENTRQQSLKLYLVWHNLPRYIFLSFTKK